MDVTKVLSQLELVLEENSIEAGSIVLRKGKEVIDSIEIDNIVSVWFYEGKDYRVIFNGEHVSNTSSLTSALDMVVELYKRYRVLVHVSRLK